MKLNKNYIAQKLPSHQTKEKSELFFPVFLPAFQKFSWTWISEFIFRVLKRAWWSKQKKTPIAPLFFYGLEHEGRTKVLENKEELPLPAKFQRLAKTQEKLIKKQHSLITELFSHLPFREENFSLTAPKISEILRVFQEKKIRKQKNQVVRWDVKSQTVVHPDAIVWKKEKSFQLEVKCFVETKNDVFPLVVEDPMLLFSDVGVVVHANDKRYKKHIGKKIIIPVINKSIPIFWEEGIDTVKGNGIQRLNPFLNLERVEGYDLPVSEEFINDDGCFTEQMGIYWGKSVFDFTSNIIETLATIGNLVAQQEVIQEVPYSKETGQRLIKKVIPTVVLDFSEQASDFFLYLEEQVPQAQKYFPEENPLVVQIESKNCYAPKLTLLCDEQKNLTLFQLSDYSNITPNLFSSFLLDQLRKGHLSGAFSLEELIDLLFLQPQSEWESIADQDARYQREHCSAYQDQLKSKDPDALIQELQEMLAELPWIAEKGKGAYEFLPPVVLKHQEITLACNDVFLQVLALFSSTEGQLMLSADDRSSDFLRVFLLLSFCLEKKIELIFPQERVTEIVLPSFPEKKKKLIDVYGRETLKLLLAQQKKYEETTLEENYEYLKHLWNLFKLLYEQGIFAIEAPESLRIAGKEFWIYTQFADLKEELLNTDFSASEFPILLEKIQHFTKEQFTRYLTLIKKEPTQEANVIALQIFLGVLEMLAPIIPEFLLLIRTTLWEQNPERKLHTEIIGTKDYRIHLLFDILQGIHRKKTELQLKKHFPIEVIIQANTDILHLVESYESSLESLFKTKKIHYLTANEVFLSGFKTFSILDITVGIKPCVLTKEEDELESLEKSYKEKTQTMDYLRSTLVALSLSPLADPLKIEEKEQELEKLKTELQQLEIAIQKAKMKKKL